MSGNETLLADKIAQYREGFRDQVSADVQAIMQNANDTLTASSLAAKALNCGASLPDFELENQYRVLMSRDELLRKPLIISFYRGAWCPYCNLELAEQQQRIDEIRQLGAEFIAISPEQPDYAMALREKHQLNFNILYDRNNQLARQLGLVFTLPEPLRKVYQTFGIDICAHNGNDHFELPVPATYIVGKDGIIRFAFINEDYRVRLEPETLIKKLIQFKNEACQEHTEAMQ
jgi:peroxiredoxin